MNDIVPAETNELANMEMEFDFGAAAPITTQEEAGGNNVFLRNLLIVSEKTADLVAAGFEPGQLVLSNAEKKYQLVEQPFHFHLIDVIGSRALWAYDESTGQKKNEMGSKPVCGSNNDISPRKNYYEVEDGAIVNELYHPYAEFDKEHPELYDASKGVLVPIVKDGCGDCRFAKFITVPVREKGKFKLDKDGKVVTENKPPMCQYQPKYVLWSYDLNEAVIYQVRGPATVLASKGRSYSKKEGKAGRIEGFPHWFNTNANPPNYTRKYTLPNGKTIDMPYPVAFNVGVTTDNSAGSIIYIPKFTLGTYPVIQDSNGNDKDANGVPYGMSRWNRLTKEIAAYKEQGIHDILGGDKAPETLFDEMAETSNIPTEPVTTPWEN